MTARELADNALLEARAPLPERDRPLEIRELVGLWLGDELSDGYAHPYLAYEIVARLAYSSPDLVRSKLYPALASSEVDGEAWAMLKAAWELWDKRRKAGSCATL